MDRQNRKKRLKKRKIKAIDNLSNQNKLNDILGHIDFKYLNNSEQESCIRKIDEDYHQTFCLVDDDEQQMIDRINSMIRKMTPLVRKYLHDDFDFTKQEMETNWNDQDKDSVKLLVSFLMFTYINTYSKTKSQIKKQ